jgi:hypothetical protein
MAAIPDWQWHPVLDASRPSFQRHPLGLLAHLGIRGAVRPAESPEHGQGLVHDHHGHQQPVIVLFDGYMQHFHGASHAELV